jgi:hypothetical protein
VIHHVRTWSWIITSSNPFCKAHIPVSKYYLIALFAVLCFCWFSRVKENTLLRKRKHAAMDHAKVQAVIDWPVSSLVCSLRGFLGLAGYYRKFIKDFGVIAAPLTKLHKEGFSWSDEANKAFLILKKALTSASVLRLSDYNDTFIVECDASGSGFGAVLHQGKGALFSSARQLHLTIML